MSNDATSAFSLFYAVFWSVLLPAMGKFGPFGIKSFTKGKKVMRAGRTSGGLLRE